MFKNLPQTDREKIADVIKYSTSRMNVCVTALTWQVDDRRLEHLGSLEGADLKFNLKVLFDELEAMRTILIDEIRELDEFRDLLTKKEGKE